MMLFMDEQLNGEDFASLVSHLEACETCKEDFDVYRAIKNGLKEDEIVCAPPDFEVCVMKQVREIHIKAVKNANTRICAAWAACAFLLAFIYYAVGDISVDFAAFFDRLAANAAESVSGLTAYFTNAQNALNSFLAAVVSYNYVFLSAFIVTVAPQVFIYKKKAKY